MDKFKLANVKLLQLFLSLFLCFLLVLMMIPISSISILSTNIKQAFANETEENDFGIFNYYDGSPNEYVYDQNVILNKLGLKTDKQDEIIKIAESAVKASLVDNKYSITEQNLPAAENNSKIKPVFTPTTINSIVSKLACVSVSQQANTNNWIFKVDNPSIPFLSGDIEINSSLARYGAEYLLPFDNFNSNIPVDFTFDYSSAKGKITITPTNEKNVNGKFLAKMDVDVDVKTLIGISNVMGIQVFNNKNGQSVSNDNIINDYQLRTANNEIVRTPTVLQGKVEVDDSIIEGEAGLPGYKITDWTSGGPFDSFKAYLQTSAERGTWLEIADFKYKGKTEEVKLLCKNDATNDTKEVPVKVTVKKRDVPVNFGGQELVYDMRLSAEQKDAVSADSSTGGLNNLKFNVDIDGQSRSFTLSVSEKDKLWKDENYVDLWGKGSSTQDLNMKTEAFSVALNETGYSKTDFNVESIPSIKIKDPESVTSDVTYKDGDGTTKYPDKEDPDVFKHNDDDGLIQVSVMDCYVSNYVEGQVPSFSKTTCNPVPKNTQSNLETPVKVFVKKKTGTDKVIRKIDRTIIYSKYTFVEYSVDKAESSSKSIIDDIAKIFFSNDDVRLVFTFLYEEDVAKTRITLDNEKTGDQHKVYTLEPVPGSNTQWFCNVAQGDDFLEEDIGDWTYHVYANVRTWWGEVKEKDIENSTIKESKNGVLHAVTNLQPPESVSYQWFIDNNGHWDAVADDKIVNQFLQNDTKLELTVKDDNFHYTFNYYANHPGTSPILATRNIDGNNKDYTYADFEDRGNGVWVLPIECKANDGDELHFEVTKISYFKNLLGDWRSEDPGKDFKDKTWSFDIDKHAPELDVKWSPENPINGKYFITNRTATLVITERNLNENDITISTDFVDEDWHSQGNKGYSLSSWNHVGNVHTITVTFLYDGDYTLHVTGKDKAGWELKYKGREGFHSEQFTQDFKDPTLQVNWDNNSVVNGKYYTAGRTATIAINERNFWDGRFHINPIVTAGHDGTVGSYNIGGWSSQGNIHFITVSFPSEGTFSMTIDGQDEALRGLEPYSQSEFVIDWTKPTINISGVANRQAYGDTAQPTVTINDANMSSATTCTVNNLGSTPKNPYSASPATSDAQYTYSYGNPEKITENDGVYRIEVNAVDMAGNTETQSLVWSVNRFGSTYVIDQDTDTIMNGYVNDESKKDIKVTEINPSGFETSRIDVTKGSFSETLNEGSDYTTQTSGGGDSWAERLYTISKDYFKEDAKYAISFYSKDNAGNENINTMDNRNSSRNAAVNVQFMLDNAKPSCLFNKLSEAEYDEPSHNASVEFEDNSREFSEAKVIIDGEEKYVKGDKLKDNDYKVDFTLKESGTPHKIVAESTDKAGNVMDSVEKEVVVSTNPFVRWFYNTPLFIGTLIGLGVVIIGVSALVISRKRKNGSSNK